MPFHLKPFLFGLLLLLQAGAIQAQVKFYATLSPKKIGKDEYTTLRIVVENSNDVKSLKLPILKQFKVISGPNNESGMSTVNGEVSQYSALSFILKPSKTGTLSIGPATATIDGASMKTNPLSLEVSNTATGGGNAGNQGIFSMPNPFEDIAEEPVAEYKDYIIKPGEDIAEKINRNMICRLEIDKTSVYVGEPVVATYKLYSRLKGQMQLAKNPAFNGFSVVEMPTGNNFTPEAGTLNGRPYNVYTIRKAQLYPLQEGNYTLEPIALDNIVQLQKQSADNNSDDFWGSQNIVEQKVTLSSKPLSVTVKPLPTVGKPASFKGAVGSFDIDANLQKPDFSTDESGLLNVVISGKGNMQLLTAPEIKWPAGIEGFDAKMTDNLQETSIPLSGSKTYKFPFVVNKEGSYQIPSVSYSYFDPGTGTYKTIQSKPISFTVTKGSGKKQFQNLTDTVNAAQSKSRLYNTIFKNRPVLISIIAFLLLTALFIYFKSFNKKKASDAVAENEGKDLDIAEEKELSADDILSEKNPLAQSELCLEEEGCGDFYPTLNRELKQFLATKFSLEPQDVHSKRIAYLLDKKGVNNLVTLELEQLLNDIEWQIYTPGASMEGHKAFFANADSLVKKINESCG